MARKQKSFSDAIRLLKKSGLENSPTPNDYRTFDWEGLSSLESRISKIFAITKDFNVKPDYMLFFVMYDIENNKIRRYIVKYLERMGCVRVQKSIFLANLTIDVYEQIRKDLAEVNDCYENMDSILIVPISPEYISSMKVIGLSIDVDLISKNKNTLFF